MNRPGGRIGLLRWLGHESEYYIDPCVRSVLTCVGVRSELPVSLRCCFQSARRIIRGKSRKWVQPPSGRRCGKLHVAVKRNICFANRRVSGVLRIGDYV